MDKFKAFVIGVMGVGIISFLWFDQGHRRQTEAEISALSRTAKETSDRLLAIEGEMKRLAASPEREPTSASAEGAGNSREVFKLRGDIAELRKRTAQLEEARASTNGAAAQLVYADSNGRSEYKSAGFDSPKAAVESKFWAIRQLDPRAYLESLAPGPELEMFQKQFSELPDGVMPGGFKNGSMYRAAGFRVMEDIAVSDDERHLKLFLEGENLNLTAIVKKFGNEWKWAGMVNR